MNTYKIRVSAPFLTETKEFDCYINAETQDEAEDIARDEYAMEMGVTIDDIGILSINKQ